MTAASRTTLATVSAIPYTVVKRLDVAQATVTEYAHLIRSGRINPTVDGKRIDDYPVAIIDEPGRPFAIVLAADDPRVEVTATPDGSAVLTGQWRGHHLERRDAVYDIFLNYFAQAAGR